MLIVEDGEAINTLCWMWQMLIEAQIKDVHGVMFFFSLVKFHHFSTKKLKNVWIFFLSINSTKFPKLLFLNPICKYQKDEK
jgi:hypothetical protein